MGTVLGPHTHTPAPQARGWRTPTARPVGGQSGEGERLTSDAPHNGGRPPPPGTPFRRPHSEQRRPASAHAVGPVLGFHARIDCTRGTRVAEPRLPAPEDARPGQGQRLTPDAPHNGGRPPPPGTAPHNPCGTQPPQGMQAQGTVLGPHTHTPAPTARGWRTPTARPVGRQSGEGERLTSDTPHNGGRHPPGDAPLPARPRATPARKGARCGAGAGSPRPHRPHLGHTGRGTPAARPRGRAAGGGTAPDTRRPSQRWQAIPTGDSPPPAPRHAAPTGHAGQGNQCWTPTPTHPRPQHGAGGPQQPAQWAGSRGRGGAWPQVPLTTVEGTPPGDPLPSAPQRATPARKNARCGAGAWSHARTDHTRDTRVAVPRLPAPEDGRPGEGQRLTPDAPHNGRRPPSPGTAPHHPHGTQPQQGMQAMGTVLGPHTHTPAPTARGWRTPTARPVGGQSGEGERLTSDAPHNGGSPPPPGTPFRHPHSEQRRPARARAVGPVLGPHARTDRTRDTRVAEPRLPAPEDGRPGEGQRLTPDTPHNGGRPSPPGDSSRPPPRHAAPTGHAGQKNQCTAPTPTHLRPQNVGGRPQKPAQWADSRGRGGAWPQTPLTTVEGTPPGTPFRRPHREQRRPARAHAVGPVLGPHARTDRTRGTRVAVPRLPAPEDRRPGEGQRLTPDAPHNGGWPSPPGTASHHPHGTQPPQGMQAKGTVLSPHTHTAAPTARGWQTQTARPVGGQSGEGERLTSDALHNGGRPPPRGCPSTTPAASNAGPQGRTLWGRCSVPTPGPTAPGTHGLRNPGCPPQRTGGRGGDSA